MFLVVDYRFEISKLELVNCLKEVIDFSLVDSLVSQSVRPDS